MGCSIREIARRIGVSDTAINKARAEGRIPENLFGRKESGRPFVIEPEKATKIISAALGDHRSKQNPERDAKAAAAETGKPAKSKKPVEPKADQKVAQIPPSDGWVDPKEEPIDPQTGLPRIHVSRQRQAHFDAMAAQAKAEAAAGTHVPREEVTKAAFEVARQIRDALLLLEERLPDQFASIRDPERIRVMLREEIRRALTQIADEVAHDQAA
jgi:ribosomal protein L25 (general stress protein Ctc)